MQRVIESIDSGILVINRELEIEYSNAPARRLLGCANHEAVSENWHRIRDQIAGHIRKRLTEENRQLSVEVQARHNSQVQYLSIDFYPVNEIQHQGYISIIRDQNVRNALVSDLQLAERFKGLSKLYRAVAHDLKAPINSMMINIELLRETIHSQETAADLAERQTRYIDVLASELERLNRLLSILLNHAMGRESNLKRFDLRDLVLDLITLVSPQAKRQKIAVSYEVPQAPVEVLGSEDWFKQALLNLFNNALEAMGETGELKVQLTRAGRVVVLEIQDTGPGISDDELKHIWKMHYTTKEGGSGIGLYVARSVIETHQGEIHLHSRPGEGCRFEITLPLAEKEGHHETAHTSAGR